MINLDVEKMTRPELEEAYFNLVAKYEEVAIANPDWLPIKVYLEHRQKLVEQRKRKHSTRQVAKLLSYLRRVGHVSREQIISVICPDPTAIDHPMKLVDVTVSRARRLLPEGVEVKTLWGFGYCMDDASKRNLKAALAEFVDPPAKYVTEQRESMI